MAGYPGEVQVLIDSVDALPWEWGFELIWDDQVESGTGDFDCNRAVILCHPDHPMDHPQQPPAAFIARFPGGPSGGSATPMKLTGSGRISENAFTTEGERYEDEPVLVYTLGGSTKLMLAQESQSTGDDTFAYLVRTGIQPAPDVETHRLQAIEPLLRRGSGVHPGAKEITIGPIASYILDKPTGVPGPTVLVPGLDTASPVKAPVGVLQRARFLGVQLFGANTDSLFRYLGAILRGRRLP